MKLYINGYRYMQQVDLLADLTTSTGCISCCYDVCIDKGTYDVLHYSSENRESTSDTYISNVSRLLKQDGLLIVMSCNWTENQLVENFDKHSKCNREVCYLTLLSFLLHFHSLKVVSR